MKWMFDREENECNKRGWMWGWKKKKLNTKALCIHSYFDILILMFLLKMKKKYLSEILPWNLLWKQKLLNAILEPSPADWLFCRCYEWTVSEPELTAGLSRQGQCLTPSVTGWSAGALDISLNLSITLSYFFVCRWMFFLNFSFGCFCLTNFQVFLLSFPSLHLS